MAWKDRLRKASFRGVDFQVEGDDAAFGRRIQVHEYPQRDIPYVEDLGRSAREFNVTAFLIGPDYMEQRDKLLEAVEKEGPGTLVHPWYGELEVSVRDAVRVKHSRENGGMCEVSLQFVESGKLEFPSGKTNTGAKSLESADELAEVSEEDFVEGIEIECEPDFIIDDALDTASGILSDIQSGLGTATALLSNPISALTDQIATALPIDPLAAAGKVMGMWNGVKGIYSTTSGLPSLIAGALNVGNILQLLGILPEQKTKPIISPEYMTSADKIVANRVAISNLFRRSMIVQAAGMSAAVKLPVYEDAIQLRNKLTAILDQESMNANDTVYASLQTLRTAVYADITDRTRQSARLQTVKPIQVQPSLAMSYDLYEDVSRAQEIIERNGIRHPGFIPAEPLKVLSK